MTHPSFFLQCNDGSQKGEYRFFLRLDTPPVSVSEVETSCISPSSSGAFGIRASSVASSDKLAVSSCVDNSPLSDEINVSGSLAGGSTVFELRVAASAAASLALFGSADVSAFPSTVSASSSSHRALMLAR